MWTAMPFIGISATLPIAAIRRILWARAPLGRSAAFPAPEE